MNNCRNPICRTIRGVDPGTGDMQEYGRDTNIDIDVPLPSKILLVMCMCAYAWYCGIMLYMPCHQVEV